MVGATSVQGLVLTIPEGPLLARHGDTGADKHSSIIVSGTVATLAKEPTLPSLAAGPKSKHKSLTVTTSRGAAMRSSATAYS